MVPHSRSRISGWSSVAQSMRNSQSSRWSSVAVRTYRIQPVEKPPNRSRAINVAATPNVIAVHPTFPAKDYKGFLAEVKRSPGKYSYASSGTGGIGHLQMELYKNLSGTFVTHIPYRGAGPALQDLIAGNVDMMFDGLGSSAQHIKAGRIKALMVSGSKRNPSFPDVPCAAELGLPDYTVTTWYGLWAPRGTPADIQTRVLEETKRLAATERIAAQRDHDDRPRHQQRREQAQRGGNR